MSWLSRWQALLAGSDEGQGATGGDEEQSEITNVPGTIWNAILRGDLDLVRELCEVDPSVVDARGAVGELPIHLCFLYHGPAHLEIARFIMDRFPHTIAAQYLGSEYLGENVLHICIIHQDLPSIRELLQREESRDQLIHARATGSFFSQGSACDYGELPLAFACCTNQPDIARLLLDYGADLECTDSRGNTLLHLMVMHNLPVMYSFVKAEAQKRAAQRAKRNTGLPRLRRQNSNRTLAASSPGDLWLRPNAEGLTPFCLAAKMDAREMFNFLLQETKQTQWTFGPVSCDLYPLAELDLAISQEGLAASIAAEEAAAAVAAKELAAANGVSASDDASDAAAAATPTAASPSRSASPSPSPSESDAPPSSAPRAGALEHIMNSGNVNLLMHPRMLDLVSQKWHKFARRIFHQRFRMVLFYLIFCTLTIVVRQTVHRIQRKEAALALAAQDALAAAGSATLPSPASHAEEYIPWAYFVYQYPLILWCMELLVLAGAYYKGSREFGEMFRSGVREYFSSSGSALLENSLSCLFCACVLVVVVLELLDLRRSQAPILALASIAGWSYLFFFLLAFKLTGPMVVMVAQMLTNDVARFCLIYLVFLMGFAQAFFVLFESVGYEGFVQSVQTCFIAMLGDFELEAFADSPYTTVSVALLVVYVVTITILLLNLLIAMMGDTFSKINEDSEKQWHLERARIIFAIENEMTAEERCDPQNKYWTSINGERFLQVLEVNPNHFPREKFDNKE